MSELCNVLVDLNEDKFNKLLHEKIDSGVDPISIINECRQGMDIVGERYKKGEYFLSELIVSGMIFNNAMADLGPLLKAERHIENLCKIVLATAKGDIHSIGKDIVATLLRASGFEVYDLGIDVASHIIVEKLFETEASILGMSGLLTPSFESMRETVRAVEKSGLRQKTKIIIGGGVVTKLVKEYTGADAYTQDGLEGVEICKNFVKETK